MCDQNQDKAPETFTSTKQESTDTAAIVEACWFAEWFEQLNTLEQDPYRKTNSNFKPICSVCEATAVPAAGVVYEKSFKFNFR